MTLASVLVPLLDSTTQVCWKRAQAPDAEAHGRRKTRKDRVFCKGRGCKQKYDNRRKQGWPGHS